MPENIAIIYVACPVDLSHRKISVDALDTATRELAERTFLSVNGRSLLCRSVRLVEQGGETCLEIVVRPDSFSEPPF